MTDNNSTPAAPDSHSLPSRRERLQMVMRLKSQRQLLVAGLGALGLVSAGLGGAALAAGSVPDAVELGKGRASIEAKPLSAFKPSPEAAGTPLPSPSASAIAGGWASYYGRELAGRRTASGETFHPEGLTAAHRTLPLGSRLRVSNARTGASVIVRVNDRGPFHGNRVIDLSYAAARDIGLIRSGTGRVELELLV